MLLLSGPATNKHLSFKLVKKSWDNIETAIMRWTEASWPRNVFPSLREGVKRTSIIVEAVGQQITVFINGYQIAHIEDGSFC